MRETLPVTTSVGSAPTLMRVGTPTDSLPTSISSTVPLKIRSPMSATVAISVPGWYEVRGTMGSPGLTARVSTVPAAGARMIDSFPVSLRRPLRVRSRFCSARFRATFASSYASRFVSTSDFDTKREAYELAKVARKRAEQNRDLTRKGRLSDTGKESIIRAPAAGTVLTRAVNPGDPIVPLTSYQPGTEMATVADMGDLIFKGTVDEIDVGKLAVGMTTRIKVGALPTDVVTGRVSRIAPQAQQKEGATLFDVEIELERSPKVTLRAGYSANPDIIIREKKDVLTIPERLVTFEDGGKKASVEVPALDPNGQPKKTDIKTGTSDGLNAEVTAGLKQGDKVVERTPKEIT